MTKEQKDLLIKDLCARLPYGVKIQSEISVDCFGCQYIAKVLGMFDDLVRHESTTIRTQNTPAFIVSQCIAEECKPILFPLSAINQEIEVNGEKIILTDFYTCINRINGGLETFICPYIPIDAICNYIDIFHRYHIDYRGLIDKGLAISALDLQENPYK